MDPDRRIRRLVKGIDADLAAALAGRDRLVLAFSGGLASLVLAALARKRGPLTCVVVGMRGAADVETALVAKSFLDYPVEVLRPSPPAVLRIARSVAAANPGLVLPDVLSLLPLVLVQQRHPDECVLSGFGLSPRSRALHRYLTSAECPPPALGRLAAGSASRRVILRLAGELAIPEGFSHAPRRTPIEGSGLGPALRAMGHARHRSVARLLSSPQTP